ncbi:hypothetical protein DENIS_0242 [Desulfonema ishimotonii]|uniref:Type II secretion system protein H n=1 Tax=Desulfonema ishimotonii TaxID=45657 RepID=A0A401FQR4_9BACT|nr:GspH/FimT family pseudopilin [Desulfonema ishimotonii]GBC59305.1 hypothetical protein DENIS_0242 [Desulfonema ishimotonii]
MRCSKGFTFIEVVVVLAIVTILSTLVLPDFLGLTKRARLKRTGRDMYSNLQKARVSAIKTGRSFRVEFFQPNGTSYTIRDSGPDGDFDNDDDVTEVIDMTVSAYKGIAFGSGHGLIPSSESTTATDGSSFSGEQALFKADGSAKGGTVYFKIDDRDDTVAISVVAATGRVKIWKNFGGGWGK